MVPISLLRLEIYLHGGQSEWLRVDRILEIYSSREAYRDFVEDYEDYKKTLDDVKGELAGK